MATHLKVAIIQLYAEVRASLPCRDSRPDIGSPFPLPRPPPAQNLHPGFQFYEETHAANIYHPMAARPAREEL